MPSNQMKYNNHIVSANYFYLIIIFSYFFFFANGYMVSSK